MNARIHSSTNPESILESFRGEFPTGSSAARHCAVPVAEEEMPPAVRALLVHHEHMTETLRSHHGCDIALGVRWESISKDVYRRRVILSLQTTQRVVEVGMVRIDLHYVSDEVRRRILGREAPLGDILISANVLRRIEPRWFFRFDRPDAIVDDFCSGEINAVYGRLGTIYCDHAPAIELLEVVTDHWIGK